METFSALLAICAGNSPVTGEFPSQTPVTRRFDVFFDLCLNKRLSKQSWNWWFETPSRPLWRHRTEFEIALIRMPQNNFDDKSTLVKAMAWDHQATNHYLNQCWPRTRSPLIGVVIPWMWCSTSFSSNVDPSTSLSYEIYDNEMNKCMIYGTNLSKVSNQWLL